jgi:N-acetylmuramoyl-L-alanine amidase
MALVWVYPKESDVVFEASSFVLGSASLDVDEVTINNIPVVCQRHENEQAFAVPVSLKPGSNSITLRTNTGESITRAITRMAPLTLNEEAPLRPLNPSLNTPHCLLIGQLLEVEVLAHETIKTLWLEIRTETGELLLQTPMVLKEPQALAPYQEFHAQATGIFGELQVNAHHPPLSLETHLFTTRLMLDEAYLNHRQDGEPLHLHYAVNHQIIEDETHKGEAEGYRISMGQVVTLWRYPRHNCISEETTALYQGSTVHGKRCSVLPPVGTPFHVMGKVGSTGFQLMPHQQGASSLSLFLLGAHEEPHVGNRGLEHIQVAQTSSTQNTHTLKLLANAPFGVSLHPHRMGVQVQLHQATLGITTFKQQHVTSPNDGFGTWHLGECNTTQAEWKANTPHAFKGISSEWSGSTLKLHAHRLPMAWEDLVVVIDAGHGGDEHGTHALNGLPEKTFNLSMALKLRSALKELGLDHVYLTRENDIPLSLEDRQRYALKHNADVCLSLHANALPDGRNPMKHKGVSVHTYTPWSSALGDALQQGLIQEAERPNDARYMSNFAMTRLPTCQSALIEYGYFIHPEEYAELLKEDTQHRMVWATANALKAHYTCAFAIVYP